MAIEDQEHYSDEDPRSSKRPSLSNFRFQSESNLGRKEVHKGAQAYDRNLLSRIGGPNVAAANNKFPGQLKPLTAPEARHAPLESPLSRWHSASSSGASPGGGYRSPFLDHIPADSSLSLRINNVTTPEASDETVSGYRSPRNSDDHGVFLDPELTRMDGLEIHERQACYGGDGEQLGATGVKRRASSPPSDGGNTREDRTSGNSNDLYHRRSMQVLGSKNSPGAGRLNSQFGASLSSSASWGARHSSSFASTWNVSGASSLTSYSGERISPGAISSSGDAEGPASPYGASQSVNRSPHNTLPKPQLAKRNIAEAHNHSDSGLPQAGPNEAHLQQVGSAKTSKPKAWEGYPFVCQCCPKKPKKFDSEEELRMHELEKQYQCAYCSNRFKNKNEAERHQNSLHLRRHSWSCAALENITQAFHPSSLHPTTFDVCGYCGEEFPAPANWTLRSEHLLQQHKFGECNQAKKFFRADHFRQHLRHSHAGTSGKWTTTLESACMKEEPTPPPMPPKHLIAPVASMAMSMRPSPTSLSSPYSGAMGSYPEVISEAHEES